MSDLRLAVKGLYFEQIKSGEKTEEYRLWNDFWKKRISGKSFKTITITHGYPRGDDAEKILKFDYCGFEIKTITHPHFGNDPVEVIALFLRNRKETHNDEGK